MPPDTTPDYLICTTANADGALRGSILKQRANKLPERTGGADVSRPSARTVTLRFSQTAIGKPADALRGRRDDPSRLPARQLHRPRARRAQDAEARPAQGHDVARGRPRPRCGGANAGAWARARNFAAASC